MIEELQIKKQQLQQKRDILLSENQNLKTVHRLADELASDQLEKSSKKAKAGVLPGEGEERLAAVQARIEQQQKEKEELKKFDEDRRTLLNVDELITKLWKEEMPSVEAVEGKLNDHKTRMKELEKLYMRKKRGAGDADLGPDRGPDRGLDRGLDPPAAAIEQTEAELERKLRERETAKARGEGEAQLKAPRKELTIEEREVKRKQILEEMKKIDAELSKQQRLDPATAIQPSQKVFENKRQVPKEQRVFEHEYQEYLIDKEVQSAAELRCQQLEYPNFEKFVQPRRVKQWSETQAVKAPSAVGQFPITNRPQVTYGTFNDLERDMLRQKFEAREGGLEADGKDARAVSEQRLLVKRLMEDQQQRKKKAEYRD